MSGSAFAPFLSPEIAAHFDTLPVPADVVLAEYIWIGGSGQDMRSKTRTLRNGPITSLSQLPVWNFDGSSTGQALGKDSEVYINPIAFYPDPFRRGNNILVLCECVLPDGKLTPHPTNSRRLAAEIFSKTAATHPWFGLEQEYTLFEKDGVTPLGWPQNGYPGAQGPYYCSVGTENAFGRRVVEAHYKACLYAGLHISGVNAEVMAGQWEYQIGPAEGISAGDELWLARYLMSRVCEEFGVRVSIDPKPKDGDWNGAGCHTNYSTEEMRAEGGYQAILKAIEKLSKKHAEHIAVYGEGNERRLTGKHETAPIHQFSSGLANRGASIRIPRQAALENKGYFEDRRPASNMDPWKVTSKIVQTTLLDD